MDTATLSAGVEAQRRRLDAGVWENLYVVGDVHGCRDAAERLLAALDPSPSELVVFVGDLVRRGPDSPGVVELVRSAPNLLSVRGNNEQKLVTGRRPPAGLSADQLRWLRGLPVAVSWEGALVVHGGLDTRKPAAEQTVDDLQTTEAVGERFWWQAYDGPARVFFGHKVLAEPYVTPSAVGLDTGCVYGGPLTAYDCARERTVSVPGEQHKQRAPERFLDPYASTSG